MKKARIAIFEGEAVIALEIDDQLASEAASYITGQVLAVDGGIAL